MQIVIKGIANAGKAYENAIKLMVEMNKRIGIPADTKLFIEDVQFKVAYEIDGKLQYATIVREVGGEEVPEIFQVVAKLDENGEIIYQEDNEKESFNDGYTLANAAGVEYEYEGIESMYNNDDLEVLSFIESTEEDDKKVMAARYAIKGEDKILIRYYKGEKLVAEKVVINEDSAE